MSKNVKTILIVVMGLLALTTVVGFVYGIQNKIETNKIYASYNETILNAVDSSIKVCQEAFNSVDATEDELVNLNDYINNINEAKSPVLKANIADSMLTYTGDYIMVLSQNYAMRLEDSRSANYTSIQEKLTSAKSQLSAARNYNTDN